MAHTFPTRSNSPSNGWSHGEPSVDALVAAGGDVAVLVDPQGVVQDVRCPGDEALLAESARWRGRPLVEVVTREARGKVQDMLSEVAQRGVSRSRQVNHPSATGPDIPIAYTLVRLRPDGAAVALGRDLRAIEALQQRLVESQQALERDYWQMRQVETRYRLLFQQVADPVLIAEADSLRVIDANPAATALLGPRPSSGWTLDAAFDPASRSLLEEHLAVVRSQGGARTLRLPLRTGGGEVIVRAALMPLEKTGHYLLQLVPVRGGEGRTEGPAAAAIPLFDAQPDAFVLVGDDGRVLHANRAFLDLAQVASVEQVRGRDIGEWMGRPGADADGVLALLRNHGSVRLFSTALRGTLGSVAEVEASGARVTGPEGAMSGLVLRDVGRRLAAGPHGARDLTLAVEQLTALVGRVSLRDLVRDTTSLVERHFIEAALELSEQNRTTAAQILGVSRQSLYVKLRRFGGTKAAAPKRGRRAGTKTSRTRRPRK